jgi:hypothetical protein
MLKTARTAKKKPKKALLPIEVAHAIADRIELVQERSGLTSRAFAKTAGLSHGGVQSVVSRLRDGHGMNIGAIWAIAGAGGVSPIWLLTGELSERKAKPEQAPAGA